MYNRFTKLNVTKYLNLFRQFKRIKNFLWSVLVVIAVNAGVIT